ncbi:MSF1-domain-containing protein [Metschnikowia bicuspidata var. bicuspidata NRRL YB-4993]|uniref:MSF1-domain-containing protein n=1 Tax=Metschnikowia bicuspidata var. bicuspidata NRRL YB-4993 TaxID=869754 RepID=A0A1A0GZ25_9ASCO|nr:MSF1-domain-containing protein [Metschnikowia bicuspidata var. bicuspidata NRRL YB-4993]OBA16952.1 MSF1-domain-containing protein [Metschnikowia bicuspidata var. bicuspidata NRRL YB-4993]
MVQIFKSSLIFDFDFKTTSVAYLNRYPNPYAQHVLSSDTLECFVDSEGRLNTTRLVVKKGLLPEFVKPFMGNKSLELWVIEKSIIDRNLKKVLAYSANVDHRRFVKVEEFLAYNCSLGLTNLKVNVRFSSNFFGLKRKIEQWSRDRFTRNLLDHRNGFMYVINKLKQASPGTPALNA